MREEVDAPGLEDDEGGKAKSDDEVGRYGREEAFGMVVTYTLRWTSIYIMDNGSFKESSFPFLAIFLYPLCKTTLYLEELAAKTSVQPPCYYVRRSNELR